MKPRLSLKARALQLLAQREHSRLELRRKLLPHALAACAASASSPASAAAASSLATSGPDDDGIASTANGAWPDENAGVDAGDWGDGGDGGGGGGDDAEAEAAADARKAAGPCLDKLLDWLQANRYLSEERFVESRVHARASRFGTRRIAHELSQHGVTLGADALVSLQTTEFERAQSLWARKFKAPADAAERARQMRFLAGRGFAADVIRRVVLAGSADPKD